MNLNTVYPSGHISYQLHIHIHKNLQIIVGALGPCNLAAGYYVYTGSAKRNLAARINRHLSDNKKLRWHIDYLLIQPEAEVTAVVTSETGECALNQELDGITVIPGFGASDCRNQCHSHLKYIPTNPAPEKL